MALISPMNVSKPKAVPMPGAASSVGQTAAAPRPRGIPKKNTRDYGKAAPAMAPPSPAPDPFGAVPGGGQRFGGM